VNGDNMDNVRRKASRTFRTKKREYLKNKINEFETNSKNIRDMHRGIHKFKKGYQPRANMVKEENGDLLADSVWISTYSINYCSDILHSSDTGEKMGVQCDCTSAICRLQ
jgi:hypothetical protein